MADSPRITGLRRRVQQDPASLAFAPLAEELRRAGRHEEAIAVCQAGLALHPEYISARATLGRALLETGDLEQAYLELSTVLGSAPQHLVALRDVAEIHQRRGDLDAALAAYRLALGLAGGDPDLERAVADLERSLPAPAVVVGRGPSTAAVESVPAASQDELLLAHLRGFLEAVLADRARRTSSSPDLARDDPARVAAS